MYKPGNFGRQVLDLRERQRQLALYSDAAGGEDPLLDFYVKVTARVLRCERCSIFIRDRATGKVWLKTGTGLRERDIVVDVDVSIVGKVIESGEPVMVEGLDQREGIHREVDARTGFTTRNVLCVPVWSINGKRVTGAVQILNKHDGEPFTDSDLAELVEMARFLQLALETALVNQQSARLVRGLIRVTLAAMFVAMVFALGFAAALFG